MPRASYLVSYIVWRVNLRKLSRKFVWALRTTTTNCRVSFIDLYSVFPTNFRIVFLLHINNTFCFPRNSTFESQSFPLFLLEKQCNSCRLPWSVGRTLHSKAGGNEFNGPFAWSSHLVQKTPRCKANNAMVPWKERILANFERSDFFVFLMSLCIVCLSPGGGVLPYITYTGMCRPKGSWFWSSWFRTGYPFQTRFLERGIIFRTHKSSSFVSSHLKLFKNRLLLKIPFNALTSKLLYSSVTP